ncbi:hypothetical protein [Microvirga zambiensis]|uniref:hypothetical protein n=1 Tax=Microvirga zambiensis TaxID=1402137 RepID=UPI00191E379D|nr:hypothetical protein [Microvirga zambiensis]
MATARLGMAALADADGLSAAEDPAHTIQGALERWRDDFNARQATGIDVKMGANHFSASDRDPLSYRQHGGER